MTDEQRKAVEELKAALYAAFSPLMRAVTFVITVATEELYKRRSR